jgi:putative ATP-grasp target RiPP
MNSRPRPSPAGRGRVSTTVPDKTTDPEEHLMSALLDRVPTLSHAINRDPSGPIGTRPFGLDSLTGLVPVSGRQPALTVDPVTQLSVVDGEVCIDTANMAGTSCNTESDGRDAIAIDTDANDD